MAAQKVLISVVAQHRFRSSKNCCERAFLRQRRGCVWGRSNINLTPPSTPLGAVAGDAGLCPPTLLLVAIAYSWIVPGLSGVNATYTFCYASVPYNFLLQFESPGTNIRAQGNSGMLQSIVLPNGQPWNSSYDNYLNLNQITLPTGGTIAYNWVVTYGCHNSSFPLYFNAKVGSRTVNANDGTGPHTWGYGTGPATQPGATFNGGITDPAGNVELHTLTPLASDSCALFDTQVEKFQGSSAPANLLQTVTTAYSSSPDPFRNIGSPTNPINVVPTSITTTWKNGPIKKTTKGYDPGFTFDSSYHGIYGKVTSESD